MSAAMSNPPIGLPRRLSVDIDGISVRSRFILASETANAPTSCARGYKQRPGWAVSRRVVNSFSAVKSAETEEQRSAACEPDLLTISSPSTSRHRYDVTCGSNTTKLTSLMRPSKPNGG